LDIISKELNLKGRAVVNPVEGSAKSVAVPAQEGEVLQGEQLTKYQRLVGKVIYPAATGRPDLAYGASLWARFMAKPTQAHRSGAERVARYARGSSGLGIEYRRGNLDLHAYVDSDFAGDLETAKSTTGWVIFAAGGPVAWCSRRQTTVARSSGEAEYIAGASVASELGFFRNFATELGVLLDAIPVKIDNRAAQTWAEKPNEVSAKARGIRVDYHSFREEVQLGRIRLVTIPSQENAADGFTKPLTGEKFGEWVDLLGMRPVSN
jgi:hypothetical protein